MTRTVSKIRFKAKLLRPAAPGKAGSWTFLILPKNASAKLPSRGMTTVEGTVNGVPFRATLEPDGQKSHWLRVTRKMSEAAGADAGDVVTLEISPTGKEPEPRMPADLRKTLAETRARRIDNACSMLASGKRRVCCFDRSGVYSKSLSAPKAAETSDR